MFSPDAASVAARNPRRRQRNASEDSVANRQPVKRQKRSGLSKETFEPPSGKINGHLDDVEETPVANGHAHVPGEQRNGSVDPTSLAIRHRGSKKGEKDRRSSRSDSGVELVWHMAFKMKVWRQWLTRVLLDTKRELHSDPAINNTRNSRRPS